MCEWDENFEMKLKKNEEEKFQLLPCEIWKFKNCTTGVPNLSESQICAHVGMLWFPYWDMIDWRGPGIPGMVCGYLQSQKK